MLSKKNILNYEYDEIKEVIFDLGEKSYRAEQVISWLAKGVSSFDEMNNVPASLIEKLKSNYFIGLPEIVRSQESKDGTVKCLFRFDTYFSEFVSELSNDDCKVVSNDVCKDNNYGSDGIDVSDGSNVKRFYDSNVEKDTTEKESVAEVEAVFMKYSYGNSICISSQAGCNMGCNFCASTMDGLQRNLTAGEMLAEVLAMKNHRGEDIGHVVIMGMGEPFDNYNEVIKFIRLIHEPKGYNLGLRNITVSTCGIVPKIREFAGDMPQVNLAISLHAPNQEMREKIMPIAKKYVYDDLMKACREYTDITSRRMTFEYALIDGINDSVECAKELSGILKGMLCHVNLIPLNEVKGRDYRKSGQVNVRKFKETLERSGIPVTVRRTLGSDIDAACGQLHRNV